MREQFITLIGELRGMWRFRWPALAAAWIVALIGWVGVYSLPDQYQAVAQIYVDTNSTLKPIIEDLTVEQDVFSRLDQVTKALLGRPQLEKVARANDLHLQANSPEGMIRIVDRLRNNAEISSDRRNPNLYTLSYLDQNPVLAKNIVQTLVDDFIENTLGADRKGSEDAQKFLQGRIAALELELREAEEALAEFKKDNVGRMPGESGGYFQRVQTEIDGLANIESQLRLAQRKRDALRGQLLGQQPVLESGAGPTSEIDLRIAQNRRNLESLRLRFTELHPEVVATKDSIAQLERQRSEQMAALKNSNSLGGASQNPVYQSIQIELNNTMVEITTLSEQASSRRRKIEELQQLIDILPDVEAELSRLNRDYGVKQGQYEELRQRLEVAELSESADQSEDVRFQLINPPIVPSTPAAPNRPLLLAGVLLGALGLGGAITFLMNQLKPVFSHAVSLQQATGLPILGSVSAMSTVERRASHRRQLTAFGAGVIGLVLVFGIVLVFQQTGSQVIQSLI